jgi:ABC-type ATPase with predicted acetyltransferase domain
VTTYELTRSSTPLVADVAIDEITAAALKPFDLDPAAPCDFYPYEMPEQMPDDFGIGLIVGASGSGKSQLLRRFGQAAAPAWQPQRSIASHFDSAEEAADRFYAVGLNAVPVWRLPYGVLSNGQKFRADLARVIGSGAVVDEFTSVVDRNVAISASRSLSAWVERTGARRLVLASCHRDVERWLRPDWTIDTDAGTFTIGEKIERPKWYADFVKGPEVGSLVLA